MPDSKEIQSWPAEKAGLFLSWEQKPFHRAGQEWERALVHPPGEAGWLLPFTVWLERTGDQPGPVPG
jgi:hypothetical protein